MFVKIHILPAWHRLDQKYIPVFRFALGVTLIMAFTTAFGGQLAYIIPVLSISFLAPPKKLSIKQGVIFVVIVAFSTIAGYLFTGFFYDFTWVFIPLVAIILLWIYYTTALPVPLKLFLLISLLATPVPKPGMDTTVWARAIAITLTTGAIFSVLVIWIVYALFPDHEVPAKAAAKPKSIVKSSDERFRQAFETFLITFPVFMVFVVFQGGNGLLVLIYIVILSMMSGISHAAGKVKIYGNLLGGVVILLFYQLIATVPFLLFFLLLYLGTALFFASHIFSGDRTSSVYKTAFSSLTLIIGQVSLGTATAGGEIWSRIIQVMIAVFYVIGMQELMNALKSGKQ